ncbi:MAG: hypothetical protein ABS935_12270 [Solibacillus sp.]|uniref:hypothetical protein n=1 Tax=Solibacillus sp. TaxID=1909654 RepID=UPI0033160C1B
MSSDKDDFLDSIDPIERGNLIKVLNGTFEKLDRQFIDQLVEIEDFFTREMKML